MRFKDFLRAMPVQLWGKNNTLPIVPPHPENWMDNPAISILTFILSWGLLYLVLLVVLKLQLYVEVGSVRTFEKCLPPTEHDMHLVYHIV